MNTIKNSNSPAGKRKPNTWGSIYRNALRRGDDHGYAAYLADAWEKRQQKKAKTHDLLQPSI